MIQCSWCPGRLDAGETGMFCLICEEGGHILCATKHFEDNHED